MTDPAATPAAAPEPKPEPWLAAGAYVDRAHTIAAELPEGLVCHIKANAALEERLGMDGLERTPVPIGPGGTTGPGRGSARFSAGLLRRVVSFISEYAWQSVEVSVGPGEPLVLTATWGGGGEGKPQRIRVVLAPTEEQP